MITSGSMADLLEPGLQEVFANAFYQEELQSIRPILYRILDSRKAQEHDLEMGDIADFAPYKGQISYDDIGEGYKTNYIHQPFTRGIKIQREAVDDDLYDVVERMPQQLGVAAFRKMETDAASLFNNAVVATITGGDGVCLGSAAHPSNVGGPSQSNLGTTALSPTELDTARIKMVQFLSNKGNPITVRPDMLVVPTELYSYAYEILNARGKVDQSINNPNFYLGRLKLVVWDNFLNSPTRWFLIDSRIMKTYLKWYDRVKVQFFKDKDFDTLAAKFAGYMRYSYGWSDFRWTYVENA